MKRAKRNTRAGKQAVVITSRDKELLFLVRECGYLSSEQVAKALFPSLDRCRRRLRQLFDAGYLKVTLLSSTQPNLISLTAKGLTLLKFLLSETASTIHPAGSIQLAAVPHHLARVETRLYLEALSRLERGRLLKWKTGNGVLAEELGFNRVHLAPDAIAELELGGDLIHLAIEIDCATEGEGVLKQKFSKYKELFNFSDVDELWVIAAASEQRKERLEELAGAVGIAEKTRVMTLEYIETRPVKLPGTRVAMEHKGISP